MVDLSGVASTALNAGKIALVTLFIGGIILGIVYFLGKRKRWDYQVEFLNQDGVTGGKDLGSIYVDAKTRVKRFWLQKARASLSPDNIPVRHIETTNWLGQRMIVKRVYLQRFGQKNFVFVDTKGLGLGLKASVGEEDVNWSVVDYEKQKLAFSNDRLMQVLPYVIFGVAVIGSIIVIWMLANKFSVLNEVASKMVEVAKILANAQTGTKVIPS